MSALQSSRLNLQLAGPNLQVKSRNRRLRKINSRTSQVPTADRTPLPAHNEWGLVQQGVAGDSNALDRLFTIYTARLYRTAFEVLHNKEDAEDAVQNALCRAYSKLHSFEGRSSFSTWLIRIVINSALMIRRRNNVRPEASLDEILDSQSERLRRKIVDAGPNPEEICAIAEIKTLLEEQIRQLPPTLQSTLRIRDVDGLSTQETVLALGIHVGAVKSRICRARRKLAVGLQQSLQKPVLAGKTACLRPS